ncbi:hypothetical protein [Chryseobacterium sp. MP_3.2]|uniref:hypothetical protein n=1 Tax=Chryseobacterium sp. MP_3.2 TaxID=3071712 RepID=UPI002E032579|nr:hypothetical protein [Chryseobacterium sp. MP_3.2]
MKWFLCILLCTFPAFQGYSERKIIIVIEYKILERSKSKVEDSAAAVQFLHSAIALYDGDEPKERVLKRQDKIEK